MSDFVQVNVISHSKNNLGYCFEHNVDRQKNGEDLEHLLNAYADHIRTASRLTSGHSAEVDSYTLPIYIRTI